MSNTVAESVKSEEAMDSLVSTLFRPMGADGVYARTARFEKVIEGLSALISRYREADTEVLRFPPVMSRRDVEKSGYLKSFPNLLGGVSCLHGQESDLRALVERFEGGEDWAAAISTSDLVLAPAACYPVYPMAASRGALPAKGLRFDVACDCFRREPSRYIDRLQSFRMREYVFVGSAEQVVEFREKWFPRAKEIADLLGLKYRIEQASDPFFGRAGKLMAISQVEQSLKFELQIPVRSEEQPTACMSFNYHLDHFGTTWGLATSEGKVAHTACVAFGLDRLAVALFAAHGVEFDRWPTTVRKALSV